MRSFPSWGDPEGAECIRCTGSLKEESDAGLCIPGGSDAVSLGIGESGIRESGIWVRKAMGIGIGVGGAIAPLGTDIENQVGYPLGD